MHDQHFLIWKYSIFLWLGWGQGSEMSRGPAGTMGLDVPGAGYGGIPCILWSIVHVPEVGLGAGLSC